MALYLIFASLYSAAISVSVDVKLSQSIKKRRWNSQNS